MHYALKATLIHQYDYVSNLKQSHDIAHFLPKIDSDWLPYEVKSNAGQFSLVYYPTNVTVEAFTDAVKNIKKKEKKL